MGIQYDNSQRIHAIKATNSPIHLVQGIKDILEKITPGYQWKENVASQMAWLEINDRMIANSIVAHFQSAGYTGIRLQFKRNTNIPVICIKPIDIDKLKNIEPLELLLNDFCNSSFIA